MNWGILGKIGAIAAAPFTGGASLAAMPAVDAITKGLGSASGAMTANRSAKANIEDEKLRLGQNQEQNYFNTMLDAEKQKSADAASAFKRLLNTTYMGSPDRVQTPGFSTYSKPISGVTPAQYDMAQGPLRDELYNRATYQTDPLHGQMPSRTLDTTALDKTGKMGFLEKLLGIGSAVTPIVGYGMQGYNNSQKK